MVDGDHMAKTLKISQCLNLAIELLIMITEQEIALEITSGFGHTDC